MLLIQEYTKRLQILKDLSFEYIFAFAHYHAPDMERQRRMSVLNLPLGVDM